MLDYWPRPRPRTPEGPVNGGSREPFGPRDGIELGRTQANDVPANGRPAAAAMTT
jgi:hypothetical protein